MTGRKGTQVPFLLAHEPANTVLRPQSIAIALSLSEL